MRLIDPILMELEQEAATTRRVLERVPTDRLEWRPHPKSMSLGQLAYHVAMTPGAVAALATKDEVEAPDFNDLPTLQAASEAVSKLDESVAQAKELLNGMDDQRLTSIWKFKKAGVELMAVPRIGFIRAVLLNHWYHHRGQLSVYLRLLNVPVPSIYGPSADETPFAVAGHV